MTTLMHDTATTTFTVQTLATVTVDGDAGELIGAVLTALEADPRAHGAVCGYDYETRRIDAIFQVQDDARVGLDRELATAGAFEIFDAALARAGLDARTVGLSIVEGDDPDLLP